MAYILMIYTIVAGGGHLDWRPIGEFYQSENKMNASEKCEAAAKQLSLKTEKYRCVRSK